MKRDDDYDPYNDDLFEIEESSTTVAARQFGSVLARGAINRLVVALEETDERVADLHPRLRIRYDDKWCKSERGVTQQSHSKQEAVYVRDAWGFAMDMIRALEHQRHKNDDKLNRFGKCVKVLEQRTGPPDLTDLPPRKKPTELQPLAAHVLTRTFVVSWKGILVEPKVKGTNIVAYTQRFQELALVCPEMVTPETQMMERYIRGLSQNIKGNVTSSKLTDIHEKIVDNNRKWEGNHNNNKYNQSKHQEVARVYTAGLTNKGKYARNLPHCSMCTRHHNGPYPSTCNNYGKETRSGETRIKEAEMEETMVKETIKLTETIASRQIMLMIKERPSRVS
nr:hypothetical protein [Tanacetum cinerariifolium]